jgi:site-specific recombinase XerD
LNPRPKAYESLAPLIMSLFLRDYLELRLTIAIKTAIIMAIMKLRGKFTVIEYGNDKGSISWRVSGTKMDGTRVRENYKTKTEALGQKQQLEIEAINAEPDHRIATTRLRPDQLAAAESAFRRLEEKKFPLTLTQAIDFALENYREPVKQTTLQAALNEFIAERQASNDRPTTIRNLKQRIGGIVDHQPEKQLAQVTDAEVKDAISKPGRGPVTRNNERRALLQFFNWASEKGYCAQNPVTAVDPVKVDHEEPQVLPLEKVRALLAAASSYKGGVVLPYVALSLFAGIRPAELSRLSWGSIKLEGGTIAIDAKGSKLRARRVIEMPRLATGKGDAKLPPNLVDWLQPHALKKTPIVGKNFRKDLDQVKERAGLVSRETAKSQAKLPKKKKGRVVQAHRYWKKLIPLCWCPDILRHTAISNHFAWCQHEGRTAQWAGNSPDMVHRHYKGLVEAEEAAEFWAIKPDSVGEIIPMPKAGAA